MGNFLLGFRALLRVWSDGDFAADVRGLLTGARLAKAGAPAAVPTATQRNDALTLLALLQREGRFLDFLQEPVDDHSDAEIGGAVRELHRDCAAVVERLFAIGPAVEVSEGAAVEVPAGFDPAQFRFVGKIPGSAPFRGHLAHRGWQAGRCDVPIWKGPAESAHIVAPVVVEF